MDIGKKLTAVFYRTKSGTEIVREWLLELSKEDRAQIGKDIKTVEFGWPVGMPTCRPMGKGLFEVRTNLTGKRIVRTLFCIHGQQMIILHSFMKKTQATPKSELDLALQRKRDLEGR